MAYDASKEVQRETALVPKNSRGDYYRVARITPTGNGMEKISIQEMYTDDDDNIQFGKKSIRIHTEALPEVVVGVLKAMSPEELADTWSLWQQEQVGEHEENVESTEEEQ